MESVYNTSKAAIRELVDSLLGGSVLNYVGHRACVRKASQSVRLIKRIAELSELFERQEQAGRQYSGGRRLTLIFGITWAMVLNLAA